jgi:hypothetical protein
MAGIPGQPEPRPSDLKDTADSLLNDSAGPNTAAGLLNDNPAPAGYHGPGAGLIKGTSDALPLIGAATGGVIGGLATLNPLGAVGGAMAGGIAGQSLRSSIESKVFANEPKSRSEFYGGLLEKGAQAGENELTGMLMPKAFQLAAETKYGKAAAQWISSAAAEPMSYVKGLVSKAREGVEAPFLSIINNKTSEMNTEQAATTIKQMITKDFVTQATASPITQQLFPKAANMSAEDLMSDLWSARNAPLLNKIKTQAPDVFDVVVQDKMSQITRSATKGGSLDLDKVRDAVTAMPEATRNLLMSSQEQKVMHSVLDNPRRARFDSLEKMGEDFVGKWASRLYEATTIGAEVAAPVAKGVMQTPGMRQMVGAGVNSVAAPMASPLVNAFSPQQPQQPPDQGF